MRNATTLAAFALILGQSGTGQASTPSSGFIENTGQLDASVRFYLPGNTSSLYFTSDAVVIDVHAGSGATAHVPRRGLPRDQEPMAAARRAGHTVWTHFDGAAPAARIEARNPLVERRHYFVGNDPRGWRMDVRVFAELIYHDVWPGIDIVFRASEDGRVGAEFVVAPGADPTKARFQNEGADPMHPGLWPDGVAAGDAETPITQSSDPGASGIALQNDPSRLVWSTYAGGTSDEIAWGVAVDASGDAVVTGLTISSQFPTTPGAYDESYNGFGDVFVSKFGPTGNLLWSTVIGGTSTNFDYGYAVALDADDQPVITGYTFSEDFPTTAGAFNRTHAGAADAFVAKFSAGGDQLLWSTFLGGESNDIGYAVTLDSAGRPVVAGRTLSSTFPVSAGVLQPFAAGEEDGFLVKLQDDASQLVWSTYLGGDAYDGAADLALDSEDHPIVFGYTASNFFPTTAGVEDDSWNGGLYDGFVSKLTEDASAFVWSRYLGGSATDYGNALALDPIGDVFVTGQTESADFPTSVGAFDTSWNDGGADAFVAKLRGLDGDLVWGSFLGGTDGYYETGFGIAIDAEGGAVVAGATPSFDFPVTPDAFDTSHNGASDVFIVHLDASGSTLRWGSFLGGALDDYGFDLASAADGEAILCGSTASLAFPTTFGASDRIYNGGDSDVFVSRVRFATPPAAVEPAGPTSFAGGTLRLEVSPNPIAGNVAHVRFHLPESSDVSLELYSAGGRRVLASSLGRLDGGTHEIDWNARDAGGKRLPAGAYYLRIAEANQSGVARVRIAR